jgi:fructose-bisphosphate aldolase class II
MNSLQVDACIEAAEELKAPLIFDVFYSNEKKTPHPVEFGIWLRLRSIESKIPIAINEDHGATFESAIKNIQCGVTSVMADRSSLPYEENVAAVRKVVEVAHGIGISIEAELGHVGDAKSYTVDRDAALTDPQDALRFIRDTGIDCLAVAVGTAHGAYPKGMEPYLDFDRLAAIKAVVGQFPLVLHGSSGTSNDQLYKACRMGINKVNINTDLELAATKAVLEANGSGHIFELAKTAIKDKLKEMIAVYGSDGKAWQPKDFSDQTSA